MSVEWSLETIQLLRTSIFESKSESKSKSESESEPEAPFLKINSIDSENLECPKHELEVMSCGIPQIHPYPYILNLGMLLVQLGSASFDKKPVIENATSSTGAGRNRLCTSLYLELSAKDKWPALELPPKDKDRYRRIVEECFRTQTNVPKPLFQKDLDAVQRRSALKKHVVDPLFELFQDMADPDETVFQPPMVARRNKHHGLQTNDGANKELKTKRCAIDTFIDFQANVCAVT